MITLAITRDNVLSQFIMYQDDAELKSKLGEVIESILGLEYVPKNTPNIAEINCILHYQDYQDRLHRLNLNKVNYEENDLILYKADKCISVTNEQLIKNPKDILPMVIDISSDFVSYFYQLSPENKRSNIKYMLDVLKMYFGLNYIIINKNEINGINSTQL